MKNKTILILIGLGFILFFSLSFQQIKIEKGPVFRLHNQDLPIVNFKSLSQTSEEPSRYAQDHILVKFDPLIRPQSINATLTAYKSQILRTLSVGGAHVVRVPKDSTVEEMIARLKQDSWVVDAQPDYIMRAAVTPNDFYFQYQTNLYNTAQAIPVPGSPSGKHRADIKAPEAWEEAKGSEDIMIAVLDTGIDFEHPDLDEKILPDGYDFVNNDNDPTDDHGHGTSVAGVAAAETNNGIGIAGVSWNSKILAVKVLNDEGEGYSSDIADAIIWVVDLYLEAKAENENVRCVINLSLGGDEDPLELLKLAVEYAYMNGVAVVAAAGNESGDVLYPAAYDDYVLAVAATDYNDVRPEWSNSGPEVDVAAPGVLVISCLPLWWVDTPGAAVPPYAAFEGTSYSAPHISGMISLLMDLKPWLTLAEIYNVVRFSADDVNADEFPGEDEYIGFGRANMEKAAVPTKITK